MSDGDHFGQFRPGKSRKITLKIFQKKIFKKKIFKFFFFDFFLSSNCDFRYVFFSTIVGCNDPVITVVLVIIERPHAKHCRGVAPPQTALVQNFSCDDLLFFQPIYILLENYYEIIFVCVGIEQLEICSYIRNIFTIVIKLPA